jgi:hydroxyethylthiazole kinase-like uncharacterized protein yjeF
LANRYGAETGRDCGSVSLNFFHALAMNELLSAAAMQAEERAVFATGITEETLLEIAGRALATTIARHFPDGETLAVFAGKGHNAADAFVAARELRKLGKWELDVRLVFSAQEMKPLAQKKLAELGCSAHRSVGAASHGGRVVILDGLLGIGASGPPQGDLADACAAMNRWRETWRVPVVAVDLPSGLGYSSCVAADLTVTFGFPKLEMVADAVTEFVGQIEVCELEYLGGDHPSAGDFLVTSNWVRAHLPPVRRFDIHKGQAGRVGLVAGSRGCVGAARLAAAAAVRAGAGLVTLFVPEEIYPIAAASVIPEVMVRTTNELGGFSADAWGIGPGLGSTVSRSLQAWLEALTAPAVVDADALNWISQTGLCGLESLAGPRLLTPHPGEMKRLMANWRPELSEASRADQAREFTRVYPVSLVLKGARSITAQAAHPLAYNSSGSPTMASGGMGDILTGICTALLAQGLNPYAAGAVGSWILGEAGAQAGKRGYGASYVLEELGGAGLIHRQPLPKLPAI